MSDFCLKIVVQFMQNKTKVYNSVKVWHQNQLTNTCLQECVKHMVVVYFYFVFFQIISLKQILIISCLLFYLIKWKFNLKHRVLPFTVYIRCSGP